MRHGENERPGHAAVFRAEQAKSAIDHELGLALKDVKQDPIASHFTTTVEGIRWLNAEADKSRSKRRAKK